MLSLPPFSLAVFTSLSACSAISRWLSMIFLISASSTMLVNPSVHISISSSGSRLISKKSTSTSGTAPIALVIIFLSRWFRAVSLSISPIRTISSTSEWSFVICLISWFTTYSLLSPTLATVSTLSWMVQITRVVPIPLISSWWFASSNSMVFACFTADSIIAAGSDNVDSRISFSNVSTVYLEA